MRKAGKIKKIGDGYYVVERVEIYHGYSEIHIHQYPGRKCKHGCSKRKCVSKRTLE